jgi:hypothetical protein
MIIGRREENLDNYFAGRFPGVRLLRSVLPGARLAGLWPTILHVRREADPFYVFISKRPATYRDTNVLRPFR